MELIFKEMEDWSGLINHIPHHGVEKPRSMPTARRVVTNSWMDNLNLGVPNNSILALDLSPKIRKMRTGLELTTHEVDRIASLGYEKKLTKSQVVPLSYEIFIPLGLFAAIKIRIPLHKLTKADLECEARRQTPCWRRWC